MQWNQARLAELSSSNGQHAGSKVNVLHFEVLRLADTHIRDSQQPKQAIVSPGPQSFTAGELQCGGEQIIDLFI